MECDGDGGREAEQNTHVETGAHREPVREVVQRVADRDHPGH